MLFTLPVLLQHKYTISIIRQSLLGEPDPPKKAKLCGPLAKLLNKQSPLLN